MCFDLTLWMNKEICVMRSRWFPVKELGVEEREELRFLPEEADWMLGVLIMLRVTAAIHHIISDGRKSRIMEPLSQYGIFSKKVSNPPQHWKSFARGNL